MTLTEHFSFAELVASDTAMRLGINNIPADPHVVGNLHVLARGLERARKAINNRPMFITSGYRSPKLNEYIGGSQSSAHMRGLAADFKVPGLSAFDVCQLIANAEDAVGFEQLIQEGSWTHIAFPLDGEPSGEILTAHFRNGRATYTKGLT